MTLKDAIEKASVLVIDGDFFPYFYVAEVNDELEFHAQVEGHEKFLNQKGLTNAVFHPDHGYWETACGIIECHVLVNVIDQEEV